MSPRVSAWRAAARAAWCTAGASAGRQPTAGLPARVPHADDVTAALRTGRSTPAQRADGPMPALRAGGTAPALRADRPSPALPARGFARALRVRLLRAAAAATLAGLAACGGGGGDGASAPDPTTSSGAASASPSVVPGTWSVIGSSTAAGIGATAGHGWADLVAATYAGRGVTVANLAVGGTVTYQGLPSSSTPAIAGRPAPDRLHNVDAALARTPRLLFVSYPSNDIASGYSADEIVANLRAIRDRALAGGVPVIVISTQPSRSPPTAQQAATAADVDRRLAADLGACFVEVRSALATPANTLDPRWDAGDGQHLNDAGHQLVFDRVKATLDSGRCVRT